MKKNSFFIAAALVAFIIGLIPKSIASSDFAYLVDESDYKAFDMSLNTGAVQRGVLSESDNIKVSVKDIIYREGKYADIHLVIENKTGTKINLSKRKIEVNSYEDSYTLDDTDRYGSEGVMTVGKHSVRTLIVTIEDYQYGAHVNGLAKVRISLNIDSNGKWTDQGGVSVVVKTDLYDDFMNQVDLVKSGEEEKKKAGTEAAVAKREADKAKEEAERKAQEVVEMRVNEGILIETDSILVELLDLKYDKESPYLKLKLTNKLGEDLSFTSTYLKINGQEMAFTFNKKIGPDKWGYGLYKLDQDAYEASGIKRIDSIELDILVKQEDETILSEALVIETFDSE